MASEHYDTVVLGQSLSGLLCAALLARRRRRVRVVCLPGPIPSRPEPIFALGAPIVRRTFDELGLVQIIRARCISDALPIGIRVGARSLVLPTDPKVLRQSLVEAFPKHGVEVGQLVDRIEGYGASLDSMLDGQSVLPPDGFPARLAFRRTVGGLLVNQLVVRPPRWALAEPLRHLIGALLLVAGRLDDPHGPITAGGVRAIHGLWRGLVPIDDARQALKGMTTDRFQNHGGVLQVERPLLRVETSRRRVEAVVLKDGTRCTAEAFVYAADDVQLAALLQQPLDRPDQARSLTFNGPKLLEAPYGWAPEDGPACLVHTTPDGSALLWRGGEAPNPHSLHPEAVGSGHAPDRPHFPLPGRADPLGLFRRPTRGRFRNLVRTGPWVLPGLGLESECLTAWQAASIAERLCPRKKRVPRR